MGSLRRGLILALPLTFGATATLAEVCDKIRPNWQPGTPVTPLGEAVLLFSAVPSLVLIVATLAALRWRSQWGGLAIVVGWSAWTSAIVFLADKDIRPQALAEGCMGTPTLFIGAVAAICVATILYTLPRETRL